LVDDEAYVDWIEGFSKVESDGVLRFLFQWAKQPKFMYTHRWRRGEVIVWQYGSTY